jgi:DNA-binding beta-propeller fold protein YncE
MMSRVAEGHAVNRGSTAGVAVNAEAQSPAESQFIGEAAIRTIAEVPMPGPAVSFDYQSLDRTTSRLYIAHMNADQLIVFDIKERKTVANLDGFKRVHGVWAVPELGRVYASVTGEKRVDAVDMKTLKAVGQAGPVVYPDGLVYAPGPKRIFVSDEYGNVDAVIDAQTSRVLKDIPLGGGAGNTVYDPGGRRILVVVHETGEVVAIDPDEMRIAARHTLPGIQKPHGVSVDAEHRLEFVAGQGNQTLAVVDLTTIKIIATHPIGKSPDVLAFDAGPGRLFVSAESGDVYVYRLRGRDLALEGQFSMPHARDVAVDPDTHLAYFPFREHRWPAGATNHRGRPAEIGKHDSGESCNQSPLLLAREAGARTMFAAPLFGALSRG